jgi:UDP-3-O-[3-hydroxymyristoyl] glucosamine N-acyltransferase
MQEITWSLGQLAEYINGSVQEENRSVLISSIKPLDQAGPTDLTFLTNPKYKSKIHSSKAGAILVGEALDNVRLPMIVVRNPYLALARILQLMYPPGTPEKGISPSAWVSSSAELGIDVVVGHGACISDGVRIGDRSIIMSGAVICEQAQIGTDCRLYPNVTLYKGVILGSRVTVHAGTVIGSDGFGYAKNGSEYVKVPQIGTVIIHDDVEIGACCTIDRGSLGNTVIHRGAKLDNLIQVAHNVVIGENTAIAALTGISGSTEIGNRVTIAGQVGINGHIRIGDDCILTGKCGVTKSVPNGSMVSGFPHLNHSEWRKQNVIVSKSAEMRKDIETIKKRLADLESRLPNHGGNIND